jgi:hypothetical protein
MSAPASSSTLKPPGLRDGQRTAMAGRLMPGSFLSRTIETSMSAPVLPQETQTCASPLRTASIADHIDVSWPLRITWLGLSSIRTTPAASRTSQRPGELATGHQPVESSLGRGR